jgi:hypothetical protein
MPAYNPAVALIIARRRFLQRAKKSQSIKQPLIKHEQPECCVIL